MAPKHGMSQHGMDLNKMNKWIITVCFAAVAAAALLISKVQPRTFIEESEDGALQNNSNSDAPKVIESTEITEFYCHFSVLDLLERGGLGSFDYYTMKAKRNGTVVKGFYYPAYRHGSKDLAYDFEADVTFMEKLQAILTEYDLAEYNGLNIYVNGLPNQYGADLSVTYASKEQLTASNNQDNFLSIDAMRALKDLFSEYAVKK